MFLTADVDYLGDFGIPLLLISFATAMVFPQATSVTVQALPADRVGVGGAANQALRQFGATFGVAITIALLGAATDVDDLLVRFDRVWWALIICGLLTTLFALPLRTGSAT